MHKFIIAQSANGHDVHVSLITTPAGRYISRMPYVVRFIKEAIAAMKLSGERLTVERDMGRIIGRTEIVKTTESDTIFYARPLKRDVFSRYAKNRYPKPSRELTLILERDDDGDYQLYDTWIGPNHPPFPGDQQETAKSKTYWQNHALAQDAQAVQSKTITKDCPY